MAEPADVQGQLGSIQPLLGHVFPIKTVQETEPPEEFGDAYVAEVNIKSASKVIKALDSALPRDPSITVSHLRRFAKWESLPEYLRSLVKSDPSPHTIFVLISPPFPEVETLQTILAPFAPPQPKCPAPEPSQPPEPARIHLYSIRIPLLPPLNSVQAETWTKSLWPVVFNPSAPRATIAPPLQVVNRAHESIQPMAGHYLALAEKVGEEAERSGRGRRVGAVIVDPAINERMVRESRDPDTDSETGKQSENSWMDAVIAVAGDARYARREGDCPSQSERHPNSGPNPASLSYNPDLEGGPELHALMRAVDLVASKRRANEEEYEPSLSPLESYFLSLPDLHTHDDSPAEEEEGQPESSTATPTTTPAPRIRSRAQGGYLCIDLDVYISREPCLCCSMGMLLSRFRAVIFPQKGRLVTGGLASAPVVSPTPAEEDEAENPGPEQQGTEKDSVTDPRRRAKYYGLHWRKELNWRALGFEFAEDGSSPVESGVDVDVFHA